MVLNLAPFREGELQGESFGRLRLQTDRAVEPMPRLPPFRRPARRQAGKCNFRLTRSDAGSWRCAGAFLCGMGRMSLDFATMFVCVWES